MARPFTYANPDAVPEELIQAARDAELRASLGDAALWDPDAPVYPVEADPYPDWDERNSRVISGPLGDAKHPGVPHTTWQCAKVHATAYARERGVKLYKFWTVPGRWFARVGKTA